ncbi:hypothetical protein KM92DES2_12420 [uncultured Desulfovibrio sp.]|uniref:Uncharacterized protein n=1 Tax=uncultured Desulfovibrio sp. TaxID=167968 RepID=A0A212K8K6_9BACT|nr:hypothetical protein KM92DES2_12420 [uncultured Desulfovibrio sp.]
MVDFMGFKYFFSAFCNPEIDIFVIFRLLITFDKLFFQQFFADFAYGPTRHAHLVRNLCHIGMIKSSYPMDAMNLREVQVIKKVFSPMPEGTGMLRNFDELGYNPVRLIHDCSFLLTWKQS